MRNWKQITRRLKIETLTLYFAYRHPLVPWYAKVFTACVVAYAFSPIDLIPDFIPVLGYLDDLILIPLGVRFAMKMIPQPVLMECRLKALLTDEKPTNWTGAIIIGIVWLVITVGIVTLIIRYL